ncbi:hypothetical protein ACFE04_004721 [Oxalis oulophora]
MEKVALKSSSSQAKVLGTIVSIAGAFVVTLYKGPRIIFVPSPSVSLQGPLQSSNPNWVFGGILLTGEYILVPLWYIVQASTQIMKEYPAELTVIFFYNLTVSFIAAIVGLITERDSSAWMLRPNIALVSVLCSGLFGSCLNNSVHAWALHLKGPFFVAMFKPLSIIIAIVMGVTFLGDALYLGSLVGATIISIGFYTVMWGKAKEEMVNCEVSSLESPTSIKVSLLQDDCNLGSAEAAWRHLHTYAQSWNDLL